MFHEPHLLLWITQSTPISNSEQLSKNVPNLESLISFPGSPDIVSTKSGTALAIASCLPLTDAHRRIRIYSRPFHHPVTKSGFRRYP